MEYLSHLLVIWASQNTTTVTFGCEDQNEAYQPPTQSINHKDEENPLSINSSLSLQVVLFPLTKSMTKKNCKK